MANSSAVAGLRDAESRALSRREPTWSNNVSGRNQQGNKAKLSGKKKRGGFILALIASLLIGGGVFLGSSNSLLAPAIANIFPTITQFDTASHSTRVDQIISVMSSGQSASTTWAKPYYKVSNWLQQRFSQNGFSVNNNSISYNGEDISGSKFINASDTNVEIRNATNSATYGNASNYFDKTANNTFMEMTGNNRNVFNGLRETGDMETDRKNYNKVISDYYEGKNSVDIGTNEYKEETNDNNTPSTDDDITTIRENTVSETNRTANDLANAQQNADSMISKLSKNVGKVINYGCTALQIGSLVAAAISGVATLNAFNNYMVTMEPISRMMGGSTSSGINILLNDMTTPHHTEIPDPTQVEWDGSITANATNGTDKSDHLTIDTGTDSQYGSMLESRNMQAALANTAYDQQAAAKHSLEASSTALFTALSAFGITKIGCNALQASMAVADIASTFVGIAASLAGGAFTLTGAAVWSGFKKIIVKLGFGLAVNFAMAGVLSFMIPLLAQELMNQGAKQLGIPAGEQFVASAATVGSITSRQNSGLSLGSEQQIAQYSQVHQDTIAKNAELDRYNHSPFDISSPNTFLGSIAYSILPLRTTTTTTALNTLVHTTSTSLAQITGNAYATDAQSQYMTTFGDCPNLESIGAKGDIYCNPIVIADTSTLNISPDDSTYNTVINNSLSCSGSNCQIKEDSNLRKYISYCVERKSPFGITDANILNELESGNVITSILPGVSEIIDIINLTQTPDNMAWADGSRCVNSADNDLWNSELKYYQRYVEDTRILEQLHAYEENGMNNPVADYRAEYRAAHPLDNSAAGVIAQYSGLTKEDSQLLLDVVAYYNYLENYDPSTTIAMDGSTLTIKSGSELIATLSPQEYNFDNNDPETTHYILISNTITYTDVRNRSHIS